MPVETTTETLREYMKALLAFGDFARYLADDVTMSFMGTDRAVRGREAVCQTITFIHAQAFKTNINVKMLVCGDGHAMAEAEFIGTHIGVFEGIPATQRAVDVPYSIAYDVKGNQITALRAYFPMELLISQLTAGQEKSRQTA